MSETWAKLKEIMHDHPWLFAIGVFVIGVVIIYIFFSGRGGGQAQTVDNSGLYSAAAAAIQSGNQLAAAEDATKAQIAIAQIAGDTQKNADAIAGSVATTQATVAGQVATTQSNNQVAQANLESTLLAHISDNNYYTDAYHTLIENNLTRRAELDTSALTSQIINSGATADQIAAYGNLLTHMFTTVGGQPA